MILYLSKSEHTQKAIAKIKSTYPEQADMDFYNKIDFYNLENNPFLKTMKRDDNRLFILDLDTNPKNQNDLRGKPFAKTLIKIGLQKSVEKIYLLISDINLGYTMYTFGGDFFEELKRSRYNAAVSVVVDHHHSLTVVCPPENSTGNWKIYGVRATNYDEFRKYIEQSSGEEPLYNKFLNFPKTELIKECDDICEWMNDEDNTFTQEAESDEEEEGSFSPRM